MMPASKGFKWTIFIAFALLVVLLAVRTVWNIAAGASLTRYLKKAAADGLPLKFAELGPPCPAGDSAAPLWKAANALLDLDSLREANLNGGPFGEWLNGAAASERARVVYGVSIAKNRRPIDLYLESSGRTCGRDPERKSIFAGAQDPMKWLWAPRLIGVETVLRAQAGDVQGSLDECLKGLSLVRLSLEEPSLINSLISISGMKNLVVCLGRIVDGNAVDPERLRPFFRVLSSGDWYDTFRRHVKAERIGALEMWEARFKRGKAVPWIGRPWLRSRFARYLTRYDDMERIYGLPRAERAKAILEFDQRAEKRNWMDKLAMRFLPAELQPGDPTIGATALKESTLEALMDTARIGLAARIYLMRVGRWPDSPAALVPEFIDNEPMDPFTGKPYVYRAGPDGLLVYSVGANLKDEGGRGTYQITQLIMPKDDDWAWRDSFKKR